MRKYLIAMIAGALTFITTNWISHYSYMLDALVESSCFFALTYLVLRAYAEGQKTTGILKLLAAILVGRLLFELPLVLIPHDGLQPIIIPLLAICSIALATLNYRLRDKTVLAMSIITLLLLDTLGYAAWIKVLYE